MNENKEISDPVIEHLLKIKARLVNEQTIAVAAAAISETKQIIQEREGFASHFILALGMIPIQFEPAENIVPRVVAIIDSYVAFSNADLSKKNLVAGYRSPETKPFVHADRIDALKRIGKSEYDFLRLIRYCEELNVCHNSDCLFAVAMLSRAILDHVPPLFNCKTFKEVANNYEGTKSFKETMLSLDSVSRKISDSHLHTHIRNKESSPTSTQVDCSQALDVLLAEIIRIS